MNLNETFLEKISSACNDRFHLAQQIINASGAVNVVEVGVWKGAFASFVLKKCPQIETYYMIDPWAKQPVWNKPFNIENEIFNDVYTEAMESVAFASDKVNVLRGATKTVINQIPDESLDFAYIDGDHTLRGITIDLIKLMPKVKEGGFIMGDDFISSPWQHSVDYEPTLVCPLSIYFAEAMDLPIYGLPHSQFLIRKLQEGEFVFKDLAGKYQDLSLNKLPAGFVRSN